MWKKTFWILFEIQFELKFGGGVCGGGGGGVPLFLPILFFQRKRQSKLINTHTRWLNEKLK